MEFRSDRRYPLAAPPEEVWAAATSIDRYRSWWPWLRHLEADAFEPGATWRCVVRPPLPYSVRMRVTLEEVEEPSWVRATVSGDVTGEAELTIRAADCGSEARLVSRLGPSNGALQTFARIAAPLVRYGHDWVLDRGARQFRSAALRDGDPEDPVPAS